uniref:Uncharacterized protein n=1 Tax=Zonotrichia albicollis TaxID=44394 RepID=A0A8D2N3E9_ZONAL
MSLPQVLCRLCWKAAFFEAVCQAYFFYQRPLHVTFLPCVSLPSVPCLPVLSLPRADVMLYLPQQCMYLHLHLLGSQVFLQSCFFLRASLFPQDLPLSVLHSLILFSKPLRSSPYPLISCFPGPCPSSGTYCSFHIHPVILSNIPPCLMPPSYPTFFLSLPFWTELCLKYPRSCGVGWR